MEKSGEAIDRRDLKIRELEDIVHEEVRSEESSEETDESEEEEGGIKTRFFFGQTCLLLDSEVEVSIGLELRPFYHANNTFTDLIYDHTSAH